MSSDDLIHPDLGKCALPRSVRRRAALAAATAARDADDLRDLLAALGLLDPALRREDAR